MLLALKPVLVLSQQLLVKCCSIRFKKRFQALDSRVSEALQSRVSESVHPSVSASSLQFAIECEARGHCACVCLRESCACDRVSVCAHVSLVCCLGAQQNDKTNQPRVCQDVILEEPMLE
jgi:hypothetical protein